MTSKEEIKKAQDYQLLVQLLQQQIEFQKSIIEEKTKDIKFYKDYFGFSPTNQFKGKLIQLNIKI